MRRVEDDDDELRPSEQGDIYTKFEDPQKLWKYQLSFEENQRRQFDEAPIYTDDESAKIMKGFLSGLCAVHELDYIHRDIKPENVMLGA